MTDFYRGFFLQPDDGNMQFACPEQALRVAPLLEVSSLEELFKNLMLDDKHFAFAEKEEEGRLKYFSGLQYFLHWKHCYFFDNHNHALFFWYLMYRQQQQPFQLLHIDQHSDMKENTHILPLTSPQEVFQFIQKYTNVGNFISPALHSGLLSDVVQIRSEWMLQHLPPPKGSYLLDIDLDFFAPEMGISLKKYVPTLRQLITNAAGVTIATSPYFLEQTLALEMVKAIFSGLSCEDSYTFC